MTKNDTKTDKVSLWVTWISLFFTLLFCLLTVFFKDNMEAIRTLMILMLASILILIVADYFACNSFYQKPEHKSQKLFVPKVFGWGLTFNPTTKLGKFFWLLAILLICFFAIFILLNPSFISQKN
ncbi:hypothetical protein OZX68_00310 [Streptococcaceae bacterium ESL0729]|nr:hypothetical protein OZX68_00310 [Streptococcaceae bacterium ESL0729]